MSRDSFQTELSGFLAKHEPVIQPRLYNIGSVLGEWRVTAFLGSGGNAEVYRVVRVDGTSGTSGTSRTADANGTAGASVGRRVPSPPQPQPNEIVVEKGLRGAEDVAPCQNESVAWTALCHECTTNLVVKELAWERLVTNKVGNSMMVVPERAYRQVQKQTEVTMVRLHGQTNEFARVISLDASREYFIEGPGILSADFKAKGGTVRVHLKNCFLFNLSTEPIDTANIRYVFEGGAYLNFINQDEPLRSVVNAHIEEFDGAYDEIRFKGPTTIEGVDRARSERNRVLMDGGVKTFFKNLHSPCHFFAPRGKYVVEDMEDSIYEKYGINPNRIPTDAEVELVAYCFDVSQEEAISILRTRDLKTSASHARI